MFNSLEKAKELIEFLREYDNGDATYGINHNELLFICEDFITAQQCADDLTNDVERLINYIRLLEKENKELRGE